MARPPALLLAVLALVVGGCGEDEPEAPPAPEPRPAVQAERFPEAEGRRLQDVLEGLPQGPRLWPGDEVPKAGRHRVAFALLDDARRPLAGAEVRVYVALRDGSRARGPYAARAESGSRYSAIVPLVAGTRYALAGVAKLDGRLVATRAVPLQVAD